MLHDAEMRNQVLEMTLRQASFLPGYN